MELFWQQMVTGLATGSVYGLVALAIVLIYRSTDVINFAQGEMAMFTTFFAWTLFSGNFLGFHIHPLHYWIMFVLTLAAAAILGALLERVVVRPVEGRPILTIVIVTLGLFAIFNSLATWSWGGIPKPFPVPPEIHVTGITFFGDGALDIGPTVVSYHDVTIMVVAVAIMLALYAFFQYTPIGLAMRGTAQNPVAARLMGIRVGNMLTLGWALSAVVGAVGGMLIAPMVYLQPPMMMGVLLYAFAAAVLGGMDSPPGAVVGGLILGIVENMVGTYTTEQYLGVDWFGPEMKLTAALVIIVLVLLIRPTGLFGRRALRRV
ncbi:MAG: branched-chain amino acid ABC transporter permease [Chloroflexota bacterium]|nr:branched-chain amino acid ABC transporter permease [Chloroflexota bacterium]